MKNKIIYRAYVNDSQSPSYAETKAFFNEMLIWAKEHCQSFENVEVIDVSDVSLICDEIIEFRFGNEQDLLMFKLKWPCGD